MINKIYIKNIRCFKELQEINLKRLTVLVGENSTGKTSFLKIYNIVSNLFYEDFHAYMNFRFFNKIEDVFVTTSPITSSKDVPFMSIKHTKYTDMFRKGATNFLLGGSIEKEEEKEDIKYTFNSNNTNSHFGEKKAQIEFKANGKKDYINIEKRDNEWILSGNNSQIILPTKLISQTEISSWLSQSIFKNNLPYSGSVDTFKDHRKNISDKDIFDFNNLVNSLRGIPFLGKNMKIIDLPPISSKPRRYYRYDYFENDEKMRELVKGLGKELNLFSDIRSKKISDEKYQLLVTTPFGEFDLIDVGYGVHTVMPFLKQLSLNTDSKDTTFLLQQVAAHLHPSAQATMAQLMAKRKSNFIIETHSDYILQRLRICVMKKNLSPEDLKILYFEREEDCTKIHEINVDKNGNLLDAPQNYRKFFTKETNQSLYLEE